LPTPTSEERATLELCVKRVTAEMKLNPRSLDTSNILQLTKSLALIVKNQVNPPNPDRMNTLVFLRLFMDGVFINDHVHNLMVLGKIQKLSDLDASLEVTIDKAF
jgi:hypothetical protein